MALLFEDQAVWDIVRGAAMTGVEHVVDLAIEKASGTGNDGPLVDSRASMIDLAKRELSIYFSKHSFTILGLAKELGGAWIDSLTNGDEEWDLEAYLEQHGEDSIADILKQFEDDANMAHQRVATLRAASELMDDGIATLTTVAKGALVFGLSLIKLKI